MIIKKIKLYNIRSYNNSTIDFKEGITLLSGDIGSGKSSILLAIEFALFGFIKGTVNGEMLLKKNANNGSVELFLEIDKKIVIIKRTLKRQKNEVIQGAGELINNNLKFNLTAVELKTKILEILGYPESLISKSKTLIFRYTVYTPQELMKEILFEDSESRMNSLRKVFDIEKYKLIKDNINILNTYLRQEIEISKNTINSYQKNDNQISDKQNILLKNQQSIDKISSEIKNFEQLIFKITETKKDLEIKIKKNTEIKNIVKTNKELISDKEKQINDFIIKINDYSNKIKELKLKKKNISLEEIDETDIKNKIIELNKIINETEYQKNNLDTKIKIYNLQFNEINQKIISNRRKISIKTEINSNYEKIKQEIDLIKNSKELLKIENLKFSEISSKIMTLNQKKKESTGIIKKICDLKECPTCMQNVDEEHKRKIESSEIEKIKNYEHAIKEQSIQLEIISKNLNELENKVNKFQELFMKLKEYEYNLKNINEIETEQKYTFEKILEIKKIIDELNLEASNKKYIEFFKIKNELNDLTKKYEEIKIKNKEIKEQKLIENDINNMELFIKKYDELININKIGIDKSKEIIKNNECEIDINAEELYNKIINDLNEKIKEMHSLEIKLNVLKNENNNIQKEILRLNEIKELLLKTKIKLDKTNSIKNWINSDFIEILDLIEKKTMSYINENFNKYFENWFNLLIENNIYARIDENFNVIVSVDGYDYAIETLSGGEKTAVALAYRLALNQVINSIQMKIKTKNLIILDEPTDGFSKEQLDRVRDVIKKTNAKQIIIVSHESLMETFADHIIRIEKNNGISEIKEN